MALQTKVGTFLGGGSLGTQAVTGVGFQPKALILWSSYLPSVSLWGTYALVGFGMTTGPTNSYSIAAGINAVSNAATNASRRMADKALTLIQGGESVLAEAGLSSFDADGFTLDWTDAASGDIYVHYLALGGDAITGANVVNWTMPTAAGSKAITGIGFQPDFILNAWTSGITAALPQNVASAGFGIGAADGTNQWAVDCFSLDSQAATDTQRGQQTDASILIIDTSPDVVAEASLASFDSDGFTHSFSVVTGSANQTISLCLKGPAIQVGSFNKPTLVAPANKDVSLPFDPKATFLASTMDVTRAAPVTSWRLGLSASDGLNHTALVTTSQDGKITSPAGSSNPNRISLNNKAFRKVNNDTKTTDADATATMGSGKFSLSFSPNDAVATEILYVAFGSGTQSYDETGGEVTVLVNTSGTAGATYKETSGTSTLLAITSGTLSHSINETTGALPITVALSGTAGQIFDEEAGSQTVLVVVAGDDFKGFDETAGEVTVQALVFGDDTQAFDETATVAILKGKLAGTDTLAFHEESGEVVVLVQGAGIDRLVTFLTDPIIGVFVSVDQPMTGTVYLDNPFSSFIRTTAR